MKDYGHGITPTTFRVERVDQFEGHCEDGYGKKPQKGTK